MNSVALTLGYVYLIMVFVSTDSFTDIVIRVDGMLHGGLFCHAESNGSRRLGGRKMDKHFHISFEKSVKICTSFTLGLPESVTL